MADAEMHRADAARRRLREADADRFEGMDDTTKFVLTLAGGAVGGAVITGIFVLVKIWLDKSTEHTQWRRNERMKVYTDFLAAVNKDSAKIKPFGNPGALELTCGHKELARIELVGSQSVRGVARKFRDHIWAYQSAAEFVAKDGRLQGIPKEDKDEHLHRYIGAVRELSKLTGDYVEAVRADLGTAGSDDDRTRGYEEGVNIGPKEL
jgi:hypothetical protein